MSANIKKRILELSKNIWEWNKEYFEDDKPSVSDQTYDLALFELERLEKEYPEYIFPNSPTQNIGSFASNKFTKYTHKHPMLSLSKAYDFQEITKFVNNLKKIVPEEKIQFFLEPKIDGLSIGLIYDNGYLIKAVTRGNGLEGEDVTENIYTIKSIPKTINYDQYLEVRGEVFLSKNNFQILNRELEKNNQSKFANPRNAASGTLRQLDYKIVEKRNLSGYFYEVLEPLKHQVFTQTDALRFLEKLHIPTNPKHKLVEIEDLENEIENFGIIKNSLDYDADGLVIKLNDLSYWDKLGRTSKFPHHSIAYKYDVEFAITKVLDIFPTVGRTGKITYVANLEPVELNQTIVSAATLHNYDFIYNMELNINDKVRIVKAGEIIPKVIALEEHDKNKTDKIFSKILICPSCKKPLTEDKENVDQFCVNELCDEIAIKKIIHFVSRDALNIITLGEKNIRLFYSLGFLKKPSDIFELYKFKNELEKINNFGQKSVKKLLENIEKSKHLEFWKALYALGIKHIGIRAAKLINKKINSFRELIDINVVEFLNLQDIGPKSIESLTLYLHNFNNIELLKKMDHYLIYKDNKIQSTIFQNLTFVITGTLSKPRIYYQELIENYGGHCSSSISKKTNYLLQGENPGSKIVQAQNFNIKIITEEEFIKLFDK